MDFKCESALNLHRQIISESLFRKQSALNLCCMAMVILDLPLQYLAGPMIRHRQPNVLNEDGVILLFTCGGAAREHLLPCSPPQRIADR